MVLDGSAIGGLRPARRRDGRPPTRTWHSAQIAFASATWARDRPDDEIGKNRSGSADQQAASKRQCRSAGRVLISRLWPAVPCFPSISEVWALEDLQAKGRCQ
jgi:hypothetical protein